jgi:hypothetical protein
MTSLLLPKTSCNIRPVQCPFAADCLHTAHILYEMAWIAGIIRNNGNNYALEIPSKVSNLQVVAYGWRSKFDCRIVWIKYQYKCILSFIQIIFTVRSLWFSSFCYTQPQLGFLEQVVCVTRIDQFFKHNAHTYWTLLNLFAGHESILWSSDLSLMYGSPVRFELVRWGWKNKYCGTQMEAREN